MASDIDIVTVRYNGRKGVFRAPAFNGPKPGDMAVVDTPQGIQTGEVIASVTEATDSDEIDFITASIGIEKPLRKVIARLKRIDYDYPDEEAEAHTGLPETE